MTLQDFEKSLAEEKRIAGLEEDRRRRKHSHHHHHRHQHRHRRSDDESHGSRRSKYRKRHADDTPGNEDASRRQLIHSDADTKEAGKHSAGLSGTSASTDHAEEQARHQSPLERDSWMQEPSSLDIEYTQSASKKPSDATQNKSFRKDFELKIHDKELNKHHLQNLADGNALPEDVAQSPAQHDVDYTFGDNGAQWRMTKLKAVYRRAEEAAMPTDDVALGQYGDLRSFDDAREEEIELDRRETYGDGYVEKEKPSGELFQDRKLEMGVRTAGKTPLPDEKGAFAIASTTATEGIPSSGISMDPTTLNRLKAQMMKAKLKGSSDASDLERKYNEALAASGNTSNSQMIVLGAMDNRMLAGGREGEVKHVNTKRGRERGLVEENEDMSIEDMVREERRTRNQIGGDGQRYAERIAKDAKFDNDLEYMDENATKLAKRVQKSEINLKNTAISDFQKMNRILDNCPLCHHEDTNTPPVAPVVSLATRVFLTLPTEPQISEGGACIIPIQHRGNLLECDDDEWEEIRNFMKSLTRMYHDQGRDVVFYENAAGPQRKKHAGMEAVPLPYSLGETAPAFFREAILVSDEEWTQHKKLIDTLAKAKQGLGKMAFRKTLAKEMPYFHVWFEIDGGLGHVVEDSNRWPRGDLFAREIIGGMLDKEPDVIKRQGRWHRGDDGRVDKFRKRWRKFDWTRVLTDT
ncbi:MAG: hypothetical protein Q9174_001300 [Haloplaca sp. 1 TL-2023]